MMQLLFTLLAKLPTTPSQGLITWKYINTKVPWSLIFLLGGGFALAEGGMYIHIYHYCHNISLY